MQFGFLLNTKDSTLANRPQAEEAIILKLQEEFFDEEVGLLATQARRVWRDGGKKLSYELGMGFRENSVMAAI